MIGNVIQKYTYHMMNSRSSRKIIGGFEEESLKLLKYAKHFEGTGTVSVVSYYWVVIDMSLLAYPLFEHFCYLHSVLYHLLPGGKSISAHLYL